MQGTKFDLKLLIADFRCGKALGIGHGVKNQGSGVSTDVDVSGFSFYVSFY
jgi:hypothetical protein